MKLVVAGHTSKQIAKLLGLSDLTVRKHRENLMRKIGISNIAQLVAHHDVAHHDVAARPVRKA